MSPSSAKFGANNKLCSLNGRRVLKPHSNRSNMRRSSLNRRVRRLAAAVASASFAAVLVVAINQPAAATAAAKSPIYIGVVVAESGALSSQNSDGGFLAGVRLAAAQINSSGGVKGHPIDLEVMDGQSTPTVGVTAAATLLSQHSLSALISGFSSSTTAGLAGIAASHQVPVFAGSILPANNTPWLYGVGNSNTEGIDVALSFIKNHLHMTRVALLTSETALGASAAAYAPVAAAKLGLTVTTTVGVPPTATDLAPQMQAIAASNPQVVFNLNLGTAEISVEQAAQSVGLKAVLYQGALPSPTSAYYDYTGNKVYFGLNDTQAPQYIANAKERTLANQCARAYENTPNGSLATANDACFGSSAVQIIAAALSAEKGTWSAAKIATVLDNGFKFTVPGEQLNYTAADHTGLGTAVNTQFTGDLAGDGSVDVVYSPVGLRKTTAPATKKKPTSKKK
ncbi:MAG TPA: ABC transporter substrate-binding protein [Solirubrobacteraceae bacterium]